MLASWFGGEVSPFTLGFKDDLAVPCVPSDFSERSMSAPTDGPFFGDNGQKKESGASAPFDNSTCSEDILGLSDPDALWPFYASANDGIGGNDPVGFEGSVQFVTGDRIAGTGSAVFDGASGIGYADGTSDFMSRGFDKLSVGFWIRQEAAGLSDQVLFEEGNAGDGIIVVLSKEGKVEVTMAGSGTKRSIKLIPFPGDGIT